MLDRGQIGSSIVSVLYFVCRPPALQLFWVVVKPFCDKTSFRKVAVLVRLSYAMGVDGIRAEHWGSLSIYCRNPPFEVLDNPL